MNSSKGKIGTTGLAQVREGRVAVVYAMIPPEHAGADALDANMGRLEARIPYFNPIATGAKKSSGHARHPHLQAGPADRDTPADSYDDASAQALTKEEGIFIVALAQDKKLLMIEYLTKRDTHALAEFAGVETGAQRLICERKHS